MPLGDHIDLVYVLSGDYWLLTINRSQHSTVLNNYIDGLKIEQDTDTDHDIKVNLGMCADSTSTTYMKVVTPFVKRIDANWAEGTGVGGFPSGLTLAINTWYHFFLIKKNDGTIDGGFDSSIAAINLLSDAGSSYEWFRRIGSIKTGDPANIIDFIQIGNRFLWLTPIHDIAANNPGTSIVSYTLSIPLGVNIIAVANICLKEQATLVNTHSYLHSPDVNDIAAATYTMTTIRGDHDRTGYAKNFTLSNTSSQIVSRLDRSDANTTLYIITLGWIDFRGKNNLD